MTAIDKQELQNLKTALLNLENTQPAVVVQTLTDINLSLCMENIVLHRNLNQLFLYIHTHKTIDDAYFISYRNKLITEIDSVIGVS